MGWMTQEIGCAVSLGNPPFGIRSWREKTLQNKMTTHHTQFRCTLHTTHSPGAHYIPHTVQVHTTHHTQSRCPAYLQDDDDLWIIPVSFFHSSTSCSGFLDRGMIFRSFYSIHRREHRLTVRTQIQCRQTHMHTYKRAYTATCIHSFTGTLVRGIQ